MGLGLGIGLNLGLNLGLGMGLGMIDYQGLGINLSDAIADLVVREGGRFFSKTSHPAFGAYREKSLKWKATSNNNKNRLDYSNKTITKENKYKMAHRDRVCFSHEYIGEQ
jgi:hypothetical protein